MPLARMRPDTSPEQLQENKLLAHHVGEFKIQSHRRAQFGPAGDVLLEQMNIGTHSCGTSLAQFGYSYNADDNAKICQCLPRARRLRHTRQPLQIAHDRRSLIIQRGSITRLPAETPPATIASNT